MDCGIIDMAEDPRDKRCFEPAMSVVEGTGIKDASFFELYMILSRKYAKTFNV
jgi:hypothetical protein